MFNLRSLLCLVAATLMAVAGSFSAQAVDPIRIGFSMALTGAVAPNGKQLLLALEIWRDDVNAKGGLLGRPVELVYYDDQSNPANVPSIYTKLITVDKVDLTIGPYATNMIAPAMPILMQHGKMTIGLLGVNVNSKFNYPKYFAMIPGGPEGTLAFSRGWFELAMAQNPRPRTVAIVAADAEFGRTTCDGARDNAKRAGLTFVYDKGYPPFATDLAPVVRAVQATNPDLVFVCAYPPDTVAFVRAANEIGLAPKMMGGALVGLFATPIKMQLGPLVNGLVITESFLPALNFPGLRDLMSRYQALAPARGIDPLGYGYVPFGYAAGQVLAQAAEATKSLDDTKLAEYIHAHAFETVAGDLRFGKDGEWVKARQFFTQFRNITGHDLAQFKDETKEVILWPAEYKTGELVYPYAEARKR
jgi:branched-chain amino acid transport system substrate-binding protein